MKALYRRGVAHGKYGMLAEAVQDLEACLKVDPENKSASVELERVRGQLLAEDQKKKKSLRLFFQNGFGEHWSVCLRKQAIGSALRDDRSSLRGIPVQRQADSSATE